MSDAHAESKSRCPYCRELGLVSTVRHQTATLSTLMETDKWYDEQGRFQVDDPNTYTTGYRCSQGHVWSESRRAGRKLILKRHDDTKPDPEPESIEDLELKFRHFESLSDKFAIAFEIERTRPYRYRLEMKGHVTYEYDTDRPMPNRWWRFWAWLLLGWTWTRVEK